MDNNTNNNDATKGFTKIPNYLIESLVKTRISGSELMVFLVICRQTFGWHKRVIALSGTRISRFTHYPTPYIFRILNKLEDKNLIVVSRGGKGCINIISVELNPSEWTVDCRKSDNYIPQDTTSNIPKVTTSDNPGDTDKRNTDKETSERNITNLKQKMIDLGLKR